MLAGTFAYELLTHKHLTLFSVRKPPSVHSFLSPLLVFPSLLYKERFCVAGTTDVAHHRAHVRAVQRERNNTQSVARGGSVSETFGDMG